MRKVLVLVLTTFYLRHCPLHRTVYRTQKFKFTNRVWETAYSAYS